MTIKKPEIGSDEYYQYIAFFSKEIRKYLPVRIYGWSGYSFGFYFTDENGNDIYATPNNASVEIFDRMIKMAYEKVLNKTAIFLT